MASPLSERLGIIPGSSAKPLSITPGSRVLKSPLSEEAIWKRLKEAGFDEESIKRRDKAELVAYIAKLEAEIYDHQHHMGILILERNELDSNYEQIKASAESSELLHKRDCVARLYALGEARKREESLKRTVGVKEECIASLEKALHEMRAECAETKVAAEGKSAEARYMVEESQKNLSEAEAKVHAAESLQTEASRYHRVAESKLQEVEAREDDLRRRIMSFKSDFDEKEKEMMLERQCLSERQKSLQQEQERLLDAQGLLNQRDDHILTKSEELNCIKKELEDRQVNIDKENRALHDEKSNLDLMKASLKRREEAFIERETELNKKEQELLCLKGKLESKESDEIQKFIASQETSLRQRKSDFEAEMEIRLKLVEHEIETKRRAWELIEIDLKQREDLLLEREHELEARARTLIEKEKGVAEMSTVLDEKHKSFRVAEKEFGLDKTLFQKEKEGIEKLRLDLQNSLHSLEDEKQRVDYAKERLEIMTSETNELSVLEIKLKEEIDLVRSQKLELLDEADKLKADKAKFETEWELLDEKKEELRKEAECVAKEKLVISQFIKDERESLKGEREAIRLQYNNDVELLGHERGEFLNKMAHDRSEWFSKMQQERADFLLEIETRKRELDNLVEKRREEVESYLRDKEEAFEQEKQKELQYISSLKDKAAEELEQVSLEMRRLHAERVEINLDRERRNREWAELNNCIEELKVQRDKLQEQRELLHVDREEIHSQTDELKKLEDLKVISDNIAMDELIRSDMECSQQKISAKVFLKQQNLVQDALNSQIEINSTDIVDRFDTPSMQKQYDVSSPNSAPFSWIKRCTEMIFRQSPEKSLIKYDKKPLMPNTSDASERQKYLGSERPPGNFSKRQHLRSFREPKVIVEVPPVVEDIQEREDFESENKEDLGEKSSPLIHGQRLQLRRKRGGGNSNDLVPLVDHEQKSKKPRQHENPTEIPLDRDVACCVFSAQSDVAMIQQAFISPDQTSEGAKDTVIMMDKIISEVTCYQTDTDKPDCPQIPELDWAGFQEGTNGQLNSHKKDVIMPYSASGKAQGICMGNNGQVTEHC
ncbi:Protein CROWDED NUCLEI [Quillaja saponaria]|uniref:Protein CROWDED NUCLEI n=1 Tax=Quillaja saponaria TaxID=32244 RepID=A0AAD7PJC6_QUISA|nr:Protein CROWDED NUCLEI [Quillaja saponaria]